MKTKVNRISRPFRFLSLLVVLALVFIPINPATAQETGDEVEIIGTVISIDDTSRSFVVETQGSILYTVYACQGFDFIKIQESDIVEVEGALNEDGSIAAAKIKVKMQDDDDLDDLSDGYYCTQSDVEHPFGARLAERYGVDYAVLQAWFCEGFGWGQIMLALITSQITGEEPGVYLESRDGGSGWGQIWKMLGLIGRNENTNSPNDKDDNGKPNFAGPRNNGNSNGKPNSAAPDKNKENKGKPDSTGRGK